MAAFLFRMLTRVYLNIHAAWASEFQEFSATHGGPSLEMEAAFMEAQHAERMSQGQYAA